MASPLDFSLAGLTPEQLKAQQDFQGAQTARGAQAAAPASGFRPPLESVDEATARRAAGGVPPRPSFTSGATRVPPGAGSLPPIDPAAGVRPPNFFQKVMGTASKNLRGVVGGGPLVAGLALANEVGSVYNTGVNPDKTRADVGFEALRSGGKLAGAAAGARLGAKSPILKQLTVPLGAVLGYFGADKYLPGKSAPGLFEQATDAAFAPAPQDSTAAAADHASAFLAEQEKLKTAGLVQQPPAPAQQAIDVTRQPNGNLSFSGVGGANAAGVNYTGPAASGLKGGTFNTVSAANFVQPSSAVSAELSAARAAAAARGDFEAVAASYGGNFGGQNNSPEAKLQAQLDNLPPIRTQGDVARYTAIAGALAAASQQGTARRTATAKEATDKAQAAFDAATAVEDRKIKKQTADAATTSADAKARDQVIFVPGELGKPGQLVNKQTGKATLTKSIPAIEEFTKFVRSQKDGRDATDEEIQVEYTRRYGG